jgi:hypothetical protein
VLDEDQIAFLEALAAGEFLAALGDVADVLVAHDHGAFDRRVEIELHVGAADAADFDLHQGCVIRMSGIGYSRTSVVPGAVRTAARTFSATAISLLAQSCGNSRSFAKFAWAHR